MSDLELQIYGLALFAAVIASFIATAFYDDNDTPEGRA